MGVTCWAPKQHFEMFKVPLLSGRVPNEGPLLFCHSRSGSTERCRHGIRTGPGLRYMHPLPRQNAVAFPLFWGTTSALLIFCTKAHCRASKSLLLTWHPEIFPVPSLGRNGESTQKIPPQSKKKKSPSQMQAWLSVLRKETAKSPPLPNPPPLKQVVCQPDVRSNG